MCVCLAPSMSVDVPSHAMERTTIALPHYGTEGVLQSGDPAFKDALAPLFNYYEGDALDALVRLKAELRLLPTDRFWTTITEGTARILGSDMTFLCKRVTEDDRPPRTEIPAFGDYGSCMIAKAFHHSSDAGPRFTVNNQEFAAYDCPCTQMRHEKVFLIPQNFNEFITKNPNQLPTPAEAYIAIPLFADGQCFAHFGAMWSKSAAERRRLSWAFIEMILHSFEDMIQQRFRQAGIFPKQHSMESHPSVPCDVVQVAQSLRPYAGSLSHELRTPMQGIVGMLDVMYASVEEAVSGQVDPKLRQIFEELKENIEVVQDSSRRAVEAADNVVHAYDMDMSVPEAPVHMLMDDADAASPFSVTSTERRPGIIVAGSNLPLSRKRRREDGASRHSSNASSSHKMARLEEPSSGWYRARVPSLEVRSGLQEAGQVHAHASAGATSADAPTTEDAELAASSMAHHVRMVAPGLRHTNLREVLRYVINEGLKMGGRPESAQAQETRNGESIEVRSRGSDGTAKTKWVEWSVDNSLPTTIFIDEKDLSKLISCVILNALKFTDQNGGRVGIRARMSSRGKYISIKISDNGPGIPAAFLPKLFKPFSRENDSTTRQSEGLGLGLMVAKGIARKLGGDLMCVRAETSGPSHGSEFEIRVPVIAGDTISRPASPYGSPLPRRASLAPVDTSRSSLFHSSLGSPGSPTRFSHAFQEAVCGAPIHTEPSSSAPTSPKSKPRDHVPIDPRVMVTSSPPTSPHGTVSSTFGPRIRKSVSNAEIDRELARKFPLTFLVAEDNKINRKLLVSMLNKFGYKSIYEAHDGTEAVRQMRERRESGEDIDVVLMDLWMPLMDGYEATQRILSETYDDNIERQPSPGRKKPTVLAVTADVTDGAQERAALVGMKGFMTKPYKINDLQRLITEYCAQREGTPVAIEA